MSEGGREGEGCGNWVAIDPNLSLKCSAHARVTQIRACVRAYAYEYWCACMCMRVCAVVCECVCDNSDRVRVRGVVVV